MQIHMLWGVKIPMRDGMQLSANVYLPVEQAAPSPAIFTLTPYIAQRWHDQGVYFALHGFPFLVVDVRGRGNSEGAFTPILNEGQDGCDIVTWLGEQPYCNGQVAMWGSSYAGHNQWSTAARKPRRLATIAPAAPSYLGVDFPMRQNIPWPYMLQWLTLTWGRTSQQNVFEDHCFWSGAFRRGFESGNAFKNLDSVLGISSETFQEWIAHPQRDEYWDRHNPTAEQMEVLSLPILSITGLYDTSQWGTLEFYRRHLQHASAAARSRHFLIIGPWNHTGTRAPQSQVAGLTVGEAGLLDMQQLHLEWYAWTMLAGPRPEFLKQNVAYYVAGAERWRYADTLDQVTARTLPLYLHSTGDASHLFSSGALQAQRSEGPPDDYLYDPRDLSSVEIELACATALCLRPNFPTDDLTDQRLIYARDGKQLVYHSEPFENDTEISGFFMLTAWLAIDQPDTDFGVWVYEIDGGGGSVLLSFDMLRARYRKSLYEQALIRTRDPLRYDFSGFSFVSRLIRRGSRLRLVIGPLNSIYFQKNYNSGGVVAEETLNEACPVTVRLFHDAVHPSVLHVPLARTGSEPV